MTLVTKTSLALIKHHLSDPPRACRQRIVGKATGRSLWYQPFEGGLGEVVFVTELYCQDCHVEPRRPAHGAPIYADEVLDIDVASSAPTAQVAQLRP